MKLRKMLCDINSEECINLMRLIETQSKKTLANWAVQYAKENYLKIFESVCPDNTSFKEAIAACEEHLNGDKKLAEVKPLLKGATLTARELNDNPVAQASARAVATACATVQTPTNALGFLFYGAAAVAYSELGLTQTAEVYDEAALKEFRKAYSSLQAVSVPNEPKPAKINWNC